MSNVQDKSVMITGGSSGIGYKFAEILLRNRARVVAIIDLPSSNGENAVATLEKEFGKDSAILISCDVTQNEGMKEAFKKVIDKFGGLDILINNAGVLNEYNWRRTIEVNTTAVIQNTLLALDHMGKHKGGKGGLIVNVASVVGLSAVCNIYQCTVLQNTPSSDLVDLWRKRITRLEYDLVLYVLATPKRQ